MVKTDVKRLAVTAMLIALEIIISRFLSISTPIAKIGFGFLPVVLIAMLYGPVYAGIGAALADFLGATLFPIAAFFPGFTMTAFLTGFVYGAFFKKQPLALRRVVPAVVLSQIVLHLGLNTVWLWMITGRGYLAIFPTRIIQCAIMIPVQIAVVMAIRKLPLSSRLGSARGMNV